MIHAATSSARRPLYRSDTVGMKKREDHIAHAIQNSVICHANLRNLD